MQSGGPLWSFTGSFFSRPDRRNAGIFCQLYLLVLPVELAVFLSGFFIPGSLPSVPMLSSPHDRHHALPVCLAFSQAGNKHISDKFRVFHFHDAFKCD